jgi:hypothetical protein
MSRTKSLPEFPLEIVELIAGFLTDDNGNLSFADLNSFVKVNRVFYSSLNYTLWKAAVASAPERVFTHLILTDQVTRLKDFLDLGADIETGLPEFECDTIDLADGKILTKWIPLKVAAALDKTDMAPLFLEYRADLVRYVQGGDPGHSAIHAAVSGERIQLLLDAGADPEQDAN